MADTLYCYHCRMYHPKEEMRRIVTRAGTRWRCIKSIEATKRGREAREAFGQQVSAQNRANAQARAQQMLERDRLERNLLAIEG